MNLLCSRALCWVALVAATPSAADVDATTDTAALIRRGEQALAEGRVEASLDDLRRALAQAEQAGAQRLMSAAAGAMGASLARQGNVAEARRHLELAIASSASCLCEDIAALSHNNLGNLLSGTGDDAAALDQYQASLRLARKHGNAHLVTQTLLNSARIAYGIGELGEARRFMDEAEKSLDALAGDTDKGQLLLALGRLRQRDIPDGADATRARLAAHRLFTEALRIAGNGADDRMQSLSFGYLAELYADEGRRAEELRLLRDALLAAQRAHAADLEYRWHWRIGRRLRGDGDIDGSVAAYRAAVKALQSVAPDLLSASGAFRSQVKPIFYELVELLLEKSETSPGETQVDLLYDARTVMEGFKAAELQDYFEDDCLPDVEPHANRLEELAPRTAVLYPILFADRIELLLSTDSGIRRATTRVSAEALGREVDRFRSGLQKLGGLDYLGPAKQLYDWLIRPLSPLLEAARVDTIVIVPDGVLRTIPLSALHDGEGLLIRRYAVATTPGLGLTDVRPFREQRGAALVAGLSEAVQGFPALPEVPEELDAIEALFPGKRLQDAQFVVGNLRRELAAKPFSLVHVATHARFEREARNSFLLTYDEKLNLSRLEELLATTRGRTEGVELLSLSACETAIGDERAALGLAGVAVKAGASSAVATLWRVSDEASALLLPEFYRLLGDPSVPSKAHALRRAQMNLMKEWRFRHPGFWAPFLLIGNWL
jgi:CHAT domain-containing protein